MSESFLSAVCSRFEWKKIQSPGPMEIIHFDINVMSCNFDVFRREGITLG